MANLTPGRGEWCSVDSLVTAYELLPHLVLDCACVFAWGRDNRSAVREASMALPL